MNEPKWTNVTRDDPCPICGKPDWCSRSADGYVVACRRNSSGISRTDCAGEDYWIHLLEEDDPVEPLDYYPELADEDTRDEVYGALLENLDLSLEHQWNLQHRGLTTAEISRRNYRTLPDHGRGHVASNLVAKFGEEICASVPGLFIQEPSTGRCYWTIAGRPGLLVPVRDVLSRIVAIKIRLDNTEESHDSRYRYLSSTHRDGPGPGQHVHVPLHDSESPQHEIRLTEGELKADVATVLSGTLTIGLPGVGAWPLAPQVLHRLGAKSVVVAYDNDALVKWPVANALVHTVPALREVSPITRNRVNLNALAGPCPSERRVCPAAASEVDVGHLQG